MFAATHSHPHEVPCSAAPTRQHHLTVSWLSQSSALLCAIDERCQWIQIDLISFKSHQHVSGLRPPQEQHTAQNSKVHHSLNHDQDRMRCARRYGTLRGKATQPYTCVWHGWGTRLSLRKPHKQSGRRGLTWSIRHRRKISILQM